MNIKPMQGEAEFFNRQFRMWVPRAVTADDIRAGWVDALPKRLRELPLIESAEP